MTERPIKDLLAAAVVIINGLKFEPAEAAEFIQDSLYNNGIAIVKEEYVRTGLPNDEDYVFSDDDRVKLKRYEDALVNIVCMMEPLYSKHTSNCIGCEGCLWEYESALQSAMNVLAGLAPNAHWGPAHNRTQQQECNLEQRCDRCVEYRNVTVPANEQAWLDRGFVKDEEDGHVIWRRGTAF